MNTCKITGTIVQANGDPVEGITVCAIPTDVPAIISGTSAGLVPATIESVTTSAGYFELDLIQGIKVRVIINAIGYKETVQIPESETAILWSISEAVETGTPTTGGGGSW